MRHLVASLCLLVLGAAAAPGQSVPVLSFDFTGGSARHTDRTDHAYYKGSRATLLRGAATVRLWNAGPIRPVLTYEHDTGCWFDIGCGDDLVCYIAPDRTCYQDFADPKGDALALGVSGNYHDQITGTVSAGTAWYINSAKYLDVNVALSTFSHVAVVADARHIVTRDERGDRVWLFPISFGLRIH